MSGMHKCIHTKQAVLAFSIAWGYGRLGAIVLAAHSLGFEFDRRPEYKWVCLLVTCLCRPSQLAYVPFLVQRTTN